MSLTTKGLYNHLSLQGTHGETLTFIVLRFMASSVWLAIFFMECGCFIWLASDLRTGVQLSSELPGTESFLACFSLTSFFKKE